jgi:hypothetical protein
VGLGCVKTRRRSTDVSLNGIQLLEGFVRCSNSPDLRKNILGVSQFAEFRHSQGHQEKNIRRSAVGTAIADRPPLSSVRAGFQHTAAYFDDAVSFELRAKGNLLLMRWKGEELMLEARGSDAFLVPHDDFALFLFRFERQNEKVIAASYGAACYVKDRHKETRSTSPAPESWSTYAGHYRSFTPWLSSFRIIVRRGSVFLVFPAGWEAQLTPIDDARFKIEDGGEIRFGSIIDGLALEATVVTAKYYRVHAP